MEKEAQKRYDTFEEEMLKRDENLQAGWKQPDQPQMEPGDEEMIPTGWMERLTRRWAATEYLDGIGEVENYEWLAK